MDVEDFERDLELDPSFDDEGIVGLARDPYKCIWPHGGFTLKEYRSPVASAPIGAHFLSALGRRARKLALSGSQKSVIVLRVGRVSRPPKEDLWADPVPAGRTRKKDSVLQGRLRARSCSPFSGPPLSGSRLLRPAPPRRSWRMPLLFGVVVPQRGFGRSIGYCFLVPAFNSQLASSVPMRIESSSRRAGGE